VSSIKNLLPFYHDINTFLPSAVRAVAWGDGHQLFATASDPFRAGELGLISIFDFPSSEMLAEGT
jgi:hypothetical protein